MELGVFTKKGFRTLIIAFVLVIAIEANILKFLYHGQKVKTYIAREILRRTVRKEWSKWNSAGVFTESTSKQGKRIAFNPNSHVPLNKILVYLNYFPLLEDESVIYTIPADGQQVKLELSPDSKGIAFEAKYLYNDASGKEEESDLSNSNRIMHELIANTNDHPELRKAIESAMPKILQNDLQTKGTFSNELQAATASSAKAIPKDVLEKAFRNSMEATLSTTILRKRPETWIAQANKEVKEQSSNLKVSMSKTVKQQWDGWRKNKLFDEVTDPKTSLETITFTNGLSPNEIFHSLRYFTHLENGPVRYNVPIDGVNFKFELAPTKPSSSEFTVKRVYDMSNIEKKQDLSDFSVLRRSIDSYVSKHLQLKAASSELRTIFKSPGKDNPPDVFLNEVKKQTGKLFNAEVSHDQSRLFTNAVNLIAASIMMEKDIPKVFWMHDIYENIKSDVEVKAEKKAIEDAVKTNWKKLKSQKKVREVPNSDPKEFVFDKNADMTAKDIFEHLRHFTVLENKPVIYKFPIDGQDVKLKLAPDSNGGFTAKYLYKDASGAPLETDLSNTEGIIHDLMGTTQGHTLLSEALKETMPEIFKQKLAQTGKFDSELVSKTNSAQSPQNIPNDLKQKALRQTLEAMASMSLLGQDGETWVDRMDKNMESQRKEIEDGLNKNIQNNGKVELKLELAASMAIDSNEIIKKWQDLIDLGYIETTYKGDIVTKINIKKETPYTLKDTFRLLQHFNELYPNQGRKRAEVTVPIGGEDRTFLMAKASNGNDQILIVNKDKYWDETTTSKITPKDKTIPPRDAKKNEELKTSYEEIFKRGLNTYDNSAFLSELMLKAIDERLDEQPNFQTELQKEAIPEDGKQQNEYEKKLKEIPDTIRAAVEFITITMIAEPVIPTIETKTKFISDIVKSMEDRRTFLKQNEMPRLTTFVGDLKTGRNPTADMLAIKFLKEIGESGARFDRVFTEESFPFMMRGGARLGRRYLFENGDLEIPAAMTLKETASDHDGETLAKRARMSCTGSSKRRKREACSLEEVNELMMVDDKSIKVEDTKVQLELYNRRDATKRQRLEIPITSDELATPQLIKENIANSERAGKNPAYAKINKGLAIHGLIFSAIGAFNDFQEGDNVHGAIALTQTLHSLGGMTRLNEIASKAAKQVLRHAAFKLARGLNMEKGLERFSAKVGKYMEKGVGKLMGDLPGVGLAFDIYFIEQDIQELAKLNLSNPADVKMLPLRIVDYILDVDTTVLNLIGTFCPEAEVITEPLIIVLSIVRMAIDDFYVDIMEEMDKVNWNSPWAGLKFIGALFKGIGKGLADFLSGGLRRQLESYSKQEKADKQLISKLKQAKSYYKITGKKGEKTIDFTKGELSTFGGFITFRMCDNGMAHIEIKDVKGKNTLVTKTFKIDHDVKDIVLGIGESREFLYETKTAKLWAFIPIKHFKVIKGAKLKSSSLYGTYYGNNKNNKFYAVQNQKQNKKQNDPPQCDYGKINIGFVTGHYHYKLYGRGGDDLFYLGPQMSKVNGGQGSDLYFVQSYGGNTIIDNFSTDNKQDMVIINVPFENITCIKNNDDLDILYKNTHHIRITNWFLPVTTENYRHISFKSQDGIIFIAKEINSKATCTPIAITKGSAKSKQYIDLNKNFPEVKQVVGSDHEDIIIGNDLANILDGGKGNDGLWGGKNSDTYIIRAGEGCDVIGNDAEDYNTTTDVLIFNVPYWRISLNEVADFSLKLSDDGDSKTCAVLLDWLKGEIHRHMIFTSLDHIVFKIKQVNGKYTKIAMVLDYSSSRTGVNISLNYPSALKGYISNKGFEQVATVSDSKYSDVIFGNMVSNFLSCTGGDDRLIGNGGSDNYMIKKSCGMATIFNLDFKKKVDLLILDYDFQDLSLKRNGYDLIINYNVRHPKVTLEFWYLNSAYRHLWVRTKDGMTLRINGDKQILEPVEISKDVKECLCKGKNCQKQHILYDLRKDPWKTVTRCQLKSTICSYTIKGNDLNNYIDPGPGNRYTSQMLKGGNGADTYVVKHGYGEFNIINNCANDNKNDTLKLGLEASDIGFSFYGKHDVILFSKTRPRSLTVRLKNYFKGPECQHIQVVTSDEVSFNIKMEHPFMAIIQMDLSNFNSQHHTLTPYQESLSSEAQFVKGYLDYPNSINGTSFTKEIEGGSYMDYLVGGAGDNVIKGRGGNDTLYGLNGDDIMFGGDGDDVIKGGDGNDYIYGGDGKDQIDGGEGGDTICFKGDGFDKKGVYVDLSGGFGKGVDAEGDTYKNIEHVYGTIHDDTLIGSDSDNNLHGLNGRDIIIAKGGNDLLIGGNGKDRYILDHAYGIKTIDNYATDRVHDTLSLANTNSDDVCVFLVANDLHLQVKESSLISLLYQKRSLSVIILDWKKSSQNRHLNILFKDTFWPNYALGRSKQHIDQMEDLVRHTRKNSNFAFTSGANLSLSWKPYQQSLLNEKTQMELLQYDVISPQNSKRVQLPKAAILNGNYTISNFTKSRHYIFALLLKYCSTIIARSYSLTYLGENKPCSGPIRVPHAQIKYKPQGPYAHGSQVNLTCANGYKLNVSNTAVYRTTCLDGAWQPKLPKCLAKAQCQKLAAPTYGRVRFQSTMEGSIARYGCQKGFQLVGLIQRRCNKDGQWEGVEPSCKGTACYQPRVKHGKFQDCIANSPTVHGTLQTPKTGFCAKLVCDNSYIEKAILNRPSLQLFPWRSVESEWHCTGPDWTNKDYDSTQMACVPPIRLVRVKSSLFHVKGVLQEFDAAQSVWKNSLSRVTTKHQQACENKLGMDPGDYTEKPKIVRSTHRVIVVECPKFRLKLNKAFEVINKHGRWERT